MPRGVKGSGKTTTSEKKQFVAKQPEQPVKQPIETVKVKKAYPTYEERLELADKKIERLTKLNSERVALIAKTEQIVDERKTALAKSESALERAIALKERIIKLMSQPPKAPVVKLSPEERAERRKEGIAKAREAKRAEKEKYDALNAALKESGKSVDDLLDELNS